MKTGPNQLQARLPAQFKGRLPTAKQLADAVREALPPPQYHAKKPNQTEA